MAARSPQTAHAVDLFGVRADFTEQGEGRPLLFLHPGHGPWGDGALLDALSADYKVVAPLMPWFGKAAGPARFASVEDLAYLYLDLLDRLDLRDVVLVGASFGGWVAAEMAVKSCERLGALVLLAPMGVKTAGREVRDIADMFGIPEKEWQERAFANPDQQPLDLKALEDDDLLGRLRAKEALARYGWSPYMHNPKLKDRLHRVKCPALVVGGAQDRILRSGYARAFADLVPHSRYEEVAAAGHFPHIERPDEVAVLIKSFLAGAKTGATPAPLRERV